MNNTTHPHVHNEHCNHDHGDHAAHHHEHAPAADHDYPIDVMVEIMSQLGRRLTVEVPGEALKPKIESRLREFARNAQLPGFRPGKVPLRLIKDRFSGAARSEVINECIEKTLPRALEQEKLKPAGYPTIESLEAAESSPTVKYVATFEVFPEIKLVDLTGVTFEKPNTSINDSDVDLVLERMRTQHRTWETVTRPATEGDQVNVDFLGTLDGVPFEGGAAKETSLILGEKRFLPDFEVGIAGMTPGQEKDIQVKFPDNYGDEKLKGQTATFKITLHKVEAPQLPPVDEAFAVLCGIEAGEGALDKLRVEVRKNMERELKQRLANTLKEKVFDKLLELNTIDIPKAVADHYIRSAKESFLERMGFKSKDKSEAVMATLGDELFLEQAQKQARLSLLLQHIVAAESLKPDPARVEEKIEEFLSSFDDSESLRPWVRQSRAEQFENLALEEQLVDYLLAKAKVEDKQVAYAEFMGL